MRQSVLCGLIFFVAALLWANPAAAQYDSKFEQFDQDLALLRKDLRSEKKKLIAANLSLTGAEAEKFWVVYDEYAAELGRIYDSRFDLIREYAADYKYLTDAKAVVFSKRVNDNAESVTKLRRKYLPLIVKVLPGAKTALFFQLENRLGLLIDLQLASEIPLVIQEPREIERKLRTLKPVPAP